ALLDSCLKQRANLVADAMLEPAGVAGIDGPDRLGLVTGQQVMELGHDLGDFLLGLFAALTVFGLRLNAASWAFATGTRRSPAGTGQDKRYPVWQSSRQGRVLWASSDDRTLLPLVPDLSRLPTSTMRNNREQRGMTRLHQSLNVEGLRL